MRLLIIAVLAVGTLATFNSVQQGNADNNGNGKKNTCNYHHSDTPTKCSPKDTTPFILPFP
jgi:hypothetical protein